MPMFSPSRACTVSRSFTPFTPSVAAVTYTCSRVSYSATLSMSGVTTWTPGYNVPGRTPQIWLTRTPALPSGTTAMLCEISSSKPASPASCAALRHRTGPKGRTGKKDVAPTPPSSSLFRFSSRRSCDAAYTSYTTSAPTLPNNPSPKITSNHFSATIAALLSHASRSAPLSSVSFSLDCELLAVNFSRRPAPQPACLEPIPVVPALAEPLPAASTETLPATTPMPSETPRLWQPPSLPPKSPPGP